LRLRETTTRFNTQAMRKFGLAFRVIAVAILLAAVGSRALIPAGWMPDPASRALVICTGHGAAARPDPGRDTPVRKDAHEVCAFRALASAGAPEPPEAPPAPAVEIAAADPATFPTGLIAQPGPPRTQSPRAPPAVA
jgi:hypothetical protein